MSAKNISLTGVTSAAADTLSVHVGVVPTNKSVWLEMVVIGKSATGALVVTETLAVFHHGSVVTTQTDQSKRLDKNANGWTAKPSVSNDGSVVVTVHAHADVAWSVFVQWFEN